MKCTVQHLCAGRVYLTLRWVALTTAALAMAAPAGATSFLATASISQTPTIPLTSASDAHTDASVVAGQSNSGIAARAYGGPSGVFGSAASGVGDFTADGEFSFSRLETNSFGVPASYVLSFYLDAGRVSLTGLNTLLACGIGGITACAEEAVAAEVTLDIKVNGSSVWGLEIEAEKTGSSPVMLTETGHASDLTLSTTQDVFSFTRAWSGHAFNVNLGTLPTGDFTLSYSMHASAYGGFIACPVGGCAGGTALIGDPLIVPAGTQTFTLLGTPQAAEVPEPASVVLLGLGVAGIMFVQRRRSASASSR